VVVGRHQRSSDDTSGDSVDSRHEALRALVEAVGDKVSDYDARVVRLRTQLALQLGCGKDVIEFGVGSPLGKRALLKSVRSYTGVDLLPQNVEELRVAFGSNGRFLVGDCCNSGLAAESADVVFGLAMIYYCEASQVIAEAHRLLRSGGCFFFCSPNPEQPRFSPSPGAYKYLSTLEYKNLAQGTGFEFQVLGGFPYTTSDVGFSRAGELLQRLWAYVPAPLKIQIRKFYKGGVVRLTEDFVEQCESTVLVQLDASNENNYKMFYYILRKN